MPDPISIAGAAQTATTVLQTVNDFKARIDAAGGAADSLIAYTKPCRAEPITLIDSRAQTLPYLRDVLSSLVSLYAGYYLQAAQLMVGIKHVDVIKMLDQLNPERSGPKLDGAYLLEKSLTELASRSNLFSKEAYQYRLPRAGETGLGVECYAEGLDDDSADRFLTGLRQRQFALEAEGGKPELPELKRNMGFGKDTARDITEVPNLAVGKMLELTIEDSGIRDVGGEKVKKSVAGTIPVMIRLITNLIDPATLVHILSDGVKDSSTNERWHAWRSGAISLADMLFAVDAIDAHRKTLMHDKSGSFAEIQRRRRNNGLVTLRSGIGMTGSKVSIGTASNLVVMTEESVKELELNTGIRFSNPAQRARVFEQSYLMLIAVIDPEWEHVTFYSRGIALPTQVSVNMIKSANKGSGPDVAEILKAYRLGHSPTL